MSAPGASAFRTEARAREPAEISEFGILQIRPLVLSRETEHDSHRFERGHSQEVARLVAYFNAKFAGENCSCLLIGVGRWGSNEPWFGIPVAWDEIPGARVIVEGASATFA